MAAAVTGNKQRCEKLTRAREKKKKKIKTFWVQTPPGFRKFQPLDSRGAAKSLSFQIPGIVGQCGIDRRREKKGKMMLK